MRQETERPPAAVTAEGQPIAVGAHGAAFFAETDAAGKTGQRDGLVQVPRSAIEQLANAALDMLDNTNCPPGASRSILPRSAIERLACIAIDALDCADGDADCEPEPQEANGDERDCDFSEDDGVPMHRALVIGPGCPVADPAEPQAGCASQVVQ